MTSVRQGGSQPAFGPRQAGGEAPVLRTPIFNPRNPANPCNLRPALEYAASPLELHRPNEPTAAPPSILPFPRDRGLRCLHCMGHDGYPSRCLPVVPTVSPFQTPAPNEAKPGLMLSLKAFKRIRLHQADWSWKAPRHAHKSISGPAPRPAQIPLFSNRNSLRPLRSLRSLRFQRFGVYGLLLACGRGPPCKIPPSSVQWREWRVRRAGAGGAAATAA
jgi:hypothetical protein